MNTILHESYAHIFTDGSKNPENGKTSSVFNVPELKVNVTKRRTDHISVYAVETRIVFDLQWIEEVKPL